MLTGKTSFDMHVIYNFTTCHSAFLFLACLVALLMPMVRKTKQKIISFLCVSHTLWPPLSHNKIVKIHKCIQHECAHLCFLRADSKTRVRVTRTAMSNWRKVSFKCSWVGQKLWPKLDRFHASLEKCKQAAMQVGWWNWLGSSQLYLRIVLAF